jgi:hypothetical protein
MSPTFYSRILILGVVTATVACGGARSTSRPPVPLVGEARSVLTAGEISGAGARTAYESIRRLRPEYLSNTRRNGPSDEPSVYIDGVRIGTIEALHAISSMTVHEIRRLGSREATTRFGTGHSAGAILIVTKSGR